MNPTTEKQWNSMMRVARPLVKAGKDSQYVQNELLMEFDFLTNSDECYETTLDVVRACEDEMYSC